MSRKVAAVPSLTTTLHRRAAELLADGEWHSFERVVRELSALIPPGQAARRYDRVLIKNRKVNGRPLEGSNRPQLESHEQIRSGRRTQVRAVLSVKAYETTAPRTGADRKIRMVQLPRPVQSDQIAAEYVQPPLEALAAMFTSHGMDWAAQQVRGAAHENGFHLAICPPGCSVTVSIPESPAPPTT